MSVLKSCRHDRPHDEWGDDLFCFAVESLVSVWVVYGRIHGRCVAEQAGVWPDVGWQAQSKKPSTWAWVEGWSIFVVPNFCKPGLGLKHYQHMLVADFKILFSARSAYKFRDTSALGYSACQDVGSGHSSFTNIASLILYLKNDEMVQNAELLGSDKKFMEKLEQKSTACWMIWCESFRSHDSRFLIKLWALC